MLRDATAENGATRVVPFSHHLERPPTRTEYPQELPVVGQAGDMFLFHNQLWHRSGQNATTDDYRNLANIFYIPGSLHRPPEAWPLVKRAVYDTFHERLQQLLARSVEAWQHNRGRARRPTSRFVTSCLGTTKDRAGSRSAGTSLTAPPQHAKMIA